MSRLPVPGDGASLLLALAGALLVWPGNASAQSGLRLAQQLGCGACHRGLPEAQAVREATPALGPGAPALDPGFVFNYLADPVVRRPELGPLRMPDFRLDEAERVALALFLGEGGNDPALESARARNPQSTRERGGAIFKALGCGNCHVHPASTPATLAPDLSAESARVQTDWLRAYLANPTPIRGPAHPSAPGSRMPDFRLSADEIEALSLWMGPSDVRTGEPLEPLSAFQAARARRLLEDRLPCLGCHLTSSGGGEIAPSLQGLARRLQASFLTEMLRDPAHAVPDAPMPRSRMVEQDVSRLARLLWADTTTPGEPLRHSLADPGHPAWTALAAANDAPEGAFLYARHCASCHGAQGRGDGWNAANLPVPPAVHADPAAMGLRPDDTLYDGIHRGAWVLDGSARMPGFASLLPDVQIRSLVRYIRELCACTQPSWAGGQP